ncbi:MAG: HNH endonuclease [Gemmataceae bacterium]|nr:HNH endonuclease [Gemmataceae bacterium]
MSDVGVEYRDIQEFPGYRVGSDGSVWTLRYKGVRRNGWRQLGLSQRKRQGYITACFRQGGKNHIRYVHRLVLEAFIGPCPDGMESRHMNGNPHDNRLENLCWGTRQQNIEDKCRHGTILRGSDVPLAKLQERDIPIIVRLYQDGISGAIIGRAFGVSGGTIRDIASGKHWKHAQPNPAQENPA